MAQQAQAARCLQAAWRRGGWSNGGGVHSHRGRSALAVRVQRAWRGMLTRRGGARGGARGAASPEYAAAALALQAAWRGSVARSQLHRSHETLAPRAVSAEEATHLGALGPCRRGQPGSAARGGEASAVEQLLADARKAHAAPSYPYPYPYPYSYPYPYPYPYPCPCPYPYPYPYP